MEKKRLLKRTKLLQSLSLICVILVILSLIRISAILPGVSKAADRQKKQAQAKTHEKEYVRGSILDRDGESIASSEEPMGDRTVVHPYAYSNVIGYWSKIYGTYGIEKTFNADLTFGPCPSGIKRGCDVMLTLDDGLQEQAYEKIKKMDAAVAVLDVSTGEILALASSPTFNAMTVEEDWDQINASEGSLLSNAYQNPAVPGSVFKLVTSKAILEAGVENETITDKGYLKVNGQKIHNYNGTEYGQVDFRKGFVKSSNVYFMDRALKIGGARLQKAAEDFMLGQEIPLDFTTLRSTFSLEDMEDNLVAVTAFGQGNTLVTPLQMAMITQAVANDGLMLKPYLVKSVTDAKGEESYTGKTEELSRAISEKNARKIQNVMEEAGESYELSRVGPDDARIAAKTGTAQRGDGTNNAWMVSYAPADHPRYVIVVCRLKTKEIGRSLAPVIEDLYDTLLKQSEEL